MVGRMNRRRFGRWAVLFLLSGLSAWAQMQVLDFGARGKVTLYLPGDWKAATTDMAGQYTLTLSPKSEAVNASCVIAVTFPEDDRFDTKARLKLRVEADCHNAAEESVERKAYAKEFNVTTGYGFYCNFTDPNLRGKPPEKGNYKVTSVGKVRPHPAVLLDVQILSDGFATEPHQQLLGAIEGMEFAAPRGR
jgi:hypothetical protein